MGVGRHTREEEVRDRVFLIRCSDVSHYGVRMTPHNAASNWTRNPTMSKKKPHTVNGNAR
jgi:hypothetical protein